MYAVIFEVEPADGRRQDYLDIAARLRPELERIDGFISVERFESLTQPGKILSLSFWRDEAAVVRWRGQEEHRALIRRGAPERPVILTAGSLSLDPARHTVERGSTPITLTPREYGVLEFLMRNKDMVVTKAEILRNVWDAHYQGPDNVVEVYVGYVRRKIDVPFGTNTIETIRGVGYRLLC